MQKRSRSKCKHKLSLKLCASFANIQNTKQPREKNVVPFCHFFTYKFSFEAKQMHSVHRPKLHSRHSNSNENRATQTKIRRKLNQKKLAPTNIKSAQCCFTPPNVHEKERQRETENQKNSYLGLIIKLPTFIGNVKSFPILSEICFSVLLFCAFFFLYVLGVLSSSFAQ